MTRSKRPFSPLVSRHMSTLAAALAICLTLGAAGSWLAIRHAFENQIKLDIVADHALLRQNFRRLKIVAVVEAIDFRLGAAPGAAPNGVYLLVDREGNPITGNLDRMPKHPIGEGPWIYFVGDIGDGPERIVASIEPVDDYYSLLVGRRMAPVAGFQRASASALAAAGLAMFVAIFGLAYFTSGAVARRFALIGAAIAAARAGERKARAPETGDDEISGLGAEVNALLDTLDRQLDHLRNMSKVIAHEIRTPLSYIKKELSGALEDARQGSDHVAAALEQTDGVLELTNALLEITDNEAAHTRFFDHIDLAELAREIAPLFEDVAAEKDVSIKRDLAPAEVLGGKWLLARLVSNLVENAVNASRDGATVACRTGTDGAAAWIEICDEGEGLPAETLDEFLGREPLDQSPRSGRGHGLGLKLVRAIALRHGARVRFLRGEGEFCVRVIFMRANRQ